MAVKRLALHAFDLPEANELLPWLGKAVARYFHLEASVQATRQDMKDLFVETRRQYDARKVLARLAESREGDLVLGVTGSDLFIPVFTFVLGEAQLEGRAAVISTFRLDEERYGLPRDPERTRERLLKEAVHELGHCHGLIHCQDSECAMYTSSGVEEVDLRSTDFCPRCLAKLRRRA